MPILTSLSHTLVIDMKPLLPLFVVGLSLLPALAGAASPPANIPQLHKQGTATQLLVDGKPWLMLAGEIRNSNSSSREYMAPIWPKLRAMNLNTVLAAVSWELIEPEEGRFDFASVDWLIEDARANDMKLVLLWFGSYKNAVSSYAPAWVRRDVARFPRVQRRDGLNTAVLSPLAEANWKADARAFAALMRHLGEIDRAKQTVIMVQVENEAGLKNDPRDRSVAAEKAFGEPTPAALLKYMEQNKETLIPEFKKVWEAAGGKAKGTWGEVFGADPFGEEVFTAWYIAGYINQVAKAGRQEYALPMFANAWLVQNEGQKPGEYPAGGPVSKLLDVWRVAAPEIALLAPDIYLGDFKGVTASYTRSGNPLLIPEASSDPLAGGRAFYAFAQHNALGFSPYAIDDLDPQHLIGQHYGRLKELLPVIAQHQGTGQMIGLLEQGDEKEWHHDFGNYRAHVTYKVDGKKERGYGLIVKLADDEFLLAGLGFAVHFGSLGEVRRSAELADVWEGRYEGSQWVNLRRLNGDETGGGYRVQLPANRLDRQAKTLEPYIVRAKLLTRP